MTNNITAREAAEVIGSLIDCPFESKGNHKKLLRVLSIVNSYVWKKGIWPGMTAQFKVRLNNKTGELITPHGYNVLLKVNVDGKPTSLGDEYFKFHQNGNGSLDECCGQNWSTKVIDLGYSPVIVQPNDPNACDCYHVAVSTDGNPNLEDGVPVSLVKGYHVEGDQEPEKVIHTRKTDKDLRLIGNPCKCEPVALTSISSEEIIEGVEFPLNGNFVLYDDLCWGRVSGISKPVTDCAVDYWAVHSVTKNFFRIARLEPNETNSSYRRYKVPEQCCSYACVHGLFKISSPAPLGTFSQQLVFGDHECLIALSKAVDFLYYKNNSEASLPFFLRGLQCLEENYREEKGAQEHPIEYALEGIEHITNTNVFDGY
jgi:hypothetical protein